MADSISFSDDKIKIINSKFSNNIGKNFCFSLDYHPKTFAPTDSWRKKYFISVLNITAFFRDCAPWLEKKSQKMQDALQNLVYWKLISSQSSSQLREVLLIIQFFRVLICHDEDMSLLKCETAYGKVKKIGITPEDFFSLSESDYEELFYKTITPVDDFFDEIINNISSFSTSDFDQIKNNKVLLGKWKDYIYESINLSSFQTQYFLKVFYNYWQMNYASSGMNFCLFANTYFSKTKIDFQNKIYQHKKEDQEDQFNPLVIFLSVIGKIIENF